ncbi:MAG: lysylphosphatidylglycerol synthase transmembrane domain-containing protein [Anaerolineae bacterium]
MKNWRLWIGVLVSAICLYLIARGIDVRSLLVALSQVHYAFLLPTLSILVFTFLARALRWRVLLSPHSEPRIRRMFNLMNIGYLVNHVSPLRLGDVLRAYLCAQLESLSLVQVLATVAIERVADTLTILFLLLCLIPFLSLPGGLLRPALGVGLLTTGAVVCLMFLAVQRKRGLELLDGLLTRFPFFDRAWIRRNFTSAMDGLAALGSFRSTARVLWWSLVIWLSTAIEFYVVMRIVGLRLPFAAALAVLCFTSLGMVVPSSPGYVGVFEYITVLTLSLFGAVKETALSYALVLHALSYLVVAILGLVGIWVEGYSYTRLREALNRVESHQVFT